MTETAALQFICDFLTFGRQASPGWIQGGGGESCGTPNFITRGKKVSSMRQVPHV